MLKKGSDNLLNTIFLLPIILGSLKMNNIATTGIKDFNIYDGRDNTWEGYVIESNEYSTSKYYTPYLSTYLKNYDNKGWSRTNISTLNFFGSNNNLAYTTLSNNVHSTNYSFNYKIFTLTQEYSILFDLPIDNLTSGYVEMKKAIVPFCIIQVLQLFLQLRLIILRLHCQLI